MALDNSSADAHAALGWVSEFFDWNLADADTQFRTAIDLEYQPEHRAERGLLVCMSGRIDPGLAEIDAAIAVDPLGPFLF